MLLGSAFGDHAVSGKSKREPYDICKLRITLEAKKARAYPKGDLMRHGKRWRRCLEVSDVHRRRDIRISPPARS
jgi:hypothetical protein